MPLLLQRQLIPHGHLGVWKIEETEDFFLRKMELHPKEEEQLMTIKGRKRLEWLSGRWLLHMMSGREIRGACLKDEYGKPYLTDSEYHISISHSHGLATVIASPILVGVDIQFLVEKITRIQHKFVCPAEAACIEEHSKLEQLHIIWGAKEVLYKAFGRRQLDFKAHMRIEPFKYDEKGGKLKGFLQKHHEKQVFDLSYKRIEDHILVYGTERTKNMSSK